MRKIVIVWIVSSLYFTNNAVAQNGNAFAKLLDEYYDVNEALNPVSATFSGDNRFNDKLPIEFTDSYRDSSKKIYQKFLTSLHEFKRNELKTEDRISYDVLQWQLQMTIEGLSLKNNVFVFNQFNGVPTTSLPLLGHGTGAQPFKTTKDYESWLLRARVFPAWTD